MGTNQEDLLRRIRERRQLSQIAERRRRLQPPAPPRDLTTDEGGPPPISRRRVEELPAQPELPPGRRFAPGQDPHETPEQQQQDLEAFQRERAERTREERGGLLTRAARGAKGVGRFLKRAIPGGEPLFEPGEEEPDELAPGVPRSRPEDFLTGTERALIDIGEGVGEIPSAVGRGVNEVLHRLALGTTAIGPEERPDIFNRPSFEEFAEGAPSVGRTTREGALADIRASRELSRETFEAPETVTGKTAEVLTQLAGEGAQFLAPGAIASRALRARGAAEGGSRFLRLIASPEGIAQRAVQNFVTGAPIDLVLSQAGADDSMAGALAVLTGDAELEEIADDPVARGSFEILGGFGAGQVLGEAIAGAGALGRRARRARGAEEGPEAGARGAADETIEAPRETIEPEGAPEPPRAETEAAPGETPGAPPQERRGGIRRRVADILDPERAREFEAQGELVRRQAEELQTRFTDKKTGLSNQDAFEKAKSRIDKDPDTEVVLIDLRNFKGVNDNLGLEAGDDMLRMVADRIRGVADELGIEPRNLFRAGGDEFVIAAPAGRGDEIGQAIVDAVGETPIEGTDLAFGARYGAGQTFSFADRAAQIAKAAETGPKGRDVVSEARKKELQEEAGGVPRETAEDERIVEAAVRTPDGEVHTGGVHATIQGRLIDEGRLDALDEELDGFVTSSGRFVSREEANIIGERSGQLAEDNPRFGTSDEPVDSDDLGLDLETGRAPEPQEAPGAPRGDQAAEAPGEARGAQEAAEDAPTIESEGARPPPSPEERAEVARGPDLEERVARRREVLQEGDEAAVPWRDRKPAPKSTGQRQSTVFPGDDSKVQTQYAVFEGGDLRASHTPTFRQRTPDEFPPEIQGRAYHGPRGQQAREHTERIISRFDPDRALDRTVSAAEGPPVVTPEGIAVAGNGRLIASQRLMFSQSVRARETKAALVERAREFGLNPALVDQMREPVLVRVIDDPEVNTLDVETLRRLNQSSDVGSGKAKDVVSEASSRAEQMRSAGAALRHFSDTIGEDQTIRAYLGTKDGTDFIRKLVEDGVISPVERARFIDVATGGATQDGKALVEQIMYAAAVGDADVLVRAPDSILRKLDSSLPAIIRASGVEEFSLEETLREALDLLASARATGNTLDDLVAQVDLTRPAPDPKVVTMARFLERAPKNTRGDVMGIKEAFRAYADDAEAFSRGTASDDLFGYEPKIADVAQREYFALAAPKESAARARMRELEERIERLEEEGADPEEIAELQLEHDRIPLEQRGAWEEIAVREFGLTDNPSDAGYILEDGRMLDFSRGGGMGRIEDHRAIAIAYSDEYIPARDVPGSNIGYMDDFIERGNIRLSVSSDGTVVADVPGELSRAQLRQLEEIVADAEDVFVVHTLGRQGEAGEVRLSRPSREELQEAIDQVVPERPSSADLAFERTFDEETDPRPLAVRQVQEGRGPESTDHPLAYDLFGEEVQPRARQGELELGGGGPQGMTQALEEARATVSQLEGVVARGAASQAEVRRLEEAQSLIRRAEGRGLSPEEVSARARELGAEQQPGDTGDLFGLAPAAQGSERLPRAGRFYDLENMVDAELVSPQEIVKQLGDAIDAVYAGLGLKTATGQMPRGGIFARALGVFKPRQQVIRQIDLGDVPVFGHEAGHAMQKLFFGSGARGGLEEAPLQALPGAIRGELEDLAKGISDESITEGWADAWRAYLDAPDYLEANAPNLLRFMEDRLDQFPSVKRAWEVARKEWTEYRISSADARIGSRISVGDREPDALSIGDRWSRFRTSVFDDFEPIRRVVDAIREEVGIEGLAEEADQLARLTRGSVGVAHHFLEYGALDFRTLRKRGPGLRDILAPIKEELDGFRRYMVARRAQELHGRDILTGLRDQDVNTVVSRAEEGANGEAFKEAFDGIQKWNRSLLEYLMDAGVINRRSFNAMQELNQSYVPFYRVIEGGRVGGLGETFGHLFAPMKRIKGSGRDIIDPLEGLVKNALLYTQVAQKQQVSQALARLASKEGVGPVLERIGTKIVPQKFRLGEIEGQLDDAIPGMREVFEEIRKQAEEDFKVATEGMSEQEIANLGLTPYDPAAEVMAIFRPGDHFGRPNTISVLQGGERVWYEVDEELFAALQGLNREQLDSFSRWMGTPARTLRAGATLAPEFLIRNPLRDQVMAFVQSEYGYLPFVDMARGVFSLLKKDELYQEWLSAGGYRAALTSLDRESMQVAARQVLEGGGVRNVIKTELEALALLKDAMAEGARLQFRAAGRHLAEAGSTAIDPLRALSALMEDATRLGEFGIARQQEALFGEGRGFRGRIQAAGRQVTQPGKEVLQRAAGAAREVSTDFARHGAKTAMLRHISAFWNARLQGYDRLARAARRDPAGFAAKAFTAITLPSLLEYYVNMDDPEYWEQPQWKRDLFWLVPLGDGDFAAIPKPFELGLIFGTLPVRILDSAVGGPGGGHELRGFLEESLVKGEVSGFLPQPTALMPLLENTVNYSFFLRRPIVPRSEEEVTARYQAGPFTSEAAQMIGRWAPGEGVSPRKIDNLLYAWTGGLGRIATEATDPLLEGRLPFTSGDTPPVASRFTDIPGLRGVTDPQAGFSSESIERFYELYARARSADRTLNFLDNQQEDAAYQAELNDEEASDLRDILPALRAAADELAELRAEVDAIRRATDLTPDEKRDRIDELGLEARATAQAVIDRQLPGGNGDVP